MEDAFGVAFFEFGVGELKPLGDCSSFFGREPDVAFGSCAAVAALGAGKSQAFAEPGGFRFGIASHDTAC